MKRKDYEMATREEVFPDRYLKAENLKGKPIILEIVQANLETLKNANGESKTKIVLYFQKTKKVLPLNRVNFDSVAEIGGPDSDDWSGVVIEVYPTKTTLSGKTVDCIRVRPPRDQRIIGKAAQPPEPPMNTDLNNEIPF